MGDGGSQFLGFSVAALGILLVERANTAISPLVPVLILGLPIVDTLSVVVRRLRAGRSPFMADRRHLHHRLLDIGLNTYQSVVLIYLLQAILIIAAWRLQYSPDWVLLGVLMLFTGVLFWVLHLWQTQHTHGRMLLQRLDVITRAVEFARARQLLTRFARILLLYGLAGFLVLGSLLVGEVGEDIGWLAVLLGLVLLLGMLMKSFPLPSAARLATFGLGASVIYLTETQGLAGGLSESWMRAWLVVIALGIALELRFGGGGFRVNALDVLVILIIAVVPNMPFVRELGLRAMVVETLVLFYASELALDDYGERRWNLLHLAVLLGLCIIALRAFVGS
jgi:UDP-GlcNAc:undecaprenyl-phosphate GlcNAc-1-phosphate transferase